MLEKNVGIGRPYDVLAECPGDRGPVNLHIEVKSHLKQVLVAELTDPGTEYAEANPHSHVVCNVMGLENRGPATWTTICGVYAELPKTVTTATREERCARILFPA